MSNAIPFAVISEKQTSYIEALKLAERLDQEIDIPRVLFVGTSCVGQSSLIPLLTGVSEIGMAGVSTKNPIRYALRYDQVDKPKISIGDYDFESTELLSDAIAQRQDKGQHGEEIEVTIFANHVQDVDLIDLPGIDVDDAKQIYNKYFQSNESMRNTGVVVVTDASNSGSQDRVLDFITRDVGATSSSWQANCLVIENMLDKTMQPLPQKQKQKQQIDDGEASQYGAQRSTCLPIGRQQRLVVVCANPFESADSNNIYPNQQSMESIVQEEARLIKQWRTRQKRPEQFSRRQNHAYGLVAAKAQFEGMFFQLFVGNAVNQLKTHLQEMYSKCSDTLRTYTLHKNQNELKQSLRGYTVQFRDLLIGVQRATASANDAVPIQQHGQTFADETSAAPSHPRSQILTSIARNPDTEEEDTTESDTLFLGYDTTQWNMVDVFSPSQELYMKMDQLLLGSAQLERLYQVFVGMLLQSDFPHFSDNEILSFASNVERDSFRTFSPEKAVTCIVQSALREILEPGIEWFCGMLLYLIDSKGEMVQQVLLRQQLKHLSGFTDFHNLLLQSYSNISVRLVKSFRDQMLKLVEIRMNTSNADILNKIASLSQIAISSLSRDDKDQKKAIDESTDFHKHGPEVAFMSTEHMTFLRKTAQEVYRANLHLLVIDLEGEFRSHVLDYVQHQLPMEFYDRGNALLWSNDVLTRSDNIQKQTFSNAIDDLHQRRIQFKAELQRLTILVSTLTRVDIAPSASIILGGDMKNKLITGKRQISDHQLAGYSNPNSLDMSDIDFKRNSFRSNFSNPNLDHISIVSSKHASEAQSPPKTADEPAQQTPKEPQPAQQTPKEPQPDTSKDCQPTSPSPSKQNQFQQQQQKMKQVIAPGKEMPAQIPAQIPAQGQTSVPNTVKGVNSVSNGSNSGKKQKKGMMSSFRNKISSNKKSSAPTTGKLPTAHKTAVAKRPFAL